MFNEVIRVGPIGLEPYKKGRDTRKAPTEEIPCATLCDPIDGSPPGSPVPGILQARTLEWDAIAFSENGLECVNLTQRTIISTTVGKNPLEEME